MSGKKKTTKKSTGKKKKSKGTMLDSLADAVAKTLGSEAVHIASNSQAGEPRMFIPSGVPALDLVLHREGKGWGMGRIVEVYGAEATCKTGLAYSVIAGCQKLGGDAILFTGSEGNFDSWLAERYGIDLDRLIVVDDPTVEGVFSSVKRAIETLDSESLLVIVIDSIASLTTKAEFEDEKFDQDRSIQHRAAQMSKALRKIGALIPNTNALLFCINQVRDKDGIGKAQPPGGRALKFYAAVRLRLEIAHQGKLKRQRGGKKYIYAFRLTVTAEKNRLAPPYSYADIILDFEEGLKEATPPKSKQAAKDVAAVDVDDEDFEDEEVLEEDDF